MVAFTLLIYWAGREGFSMPLFKGYRPNKFAVGVSLPCRFIS